MLIFNFFMYFWKSMFNRYECKINIINIIDMNVKRLNEIKYNKYKKK